MPPFYLGYAYEALARATFVAGDREATQHYLSVAKRVADTIPNQAAKQQLLEDLMTIRTKYLTGSQDGQDVDSC